MQIHELQGRNVLPIVSPPAEGKRDGVISHNEIFHALRLARRFLDSSSGREHVKSESQRIAQAIQTVPGFVGAFGAGFPYYAGKQPVEEISGFLDRTSSHVLEDSARNPHGWGCPGCQRERQLPDLKTQCKPCDAVSLKPRVLFTALPDIDVFTVNSDPNSTIERETQQRLTQMGYAQSDTDIAKAFNRTVEALKGITAGVATSSKLPVDVHVLARCDVHESLGKLRMGHLDVAIPARSLHTSWEDTSMPFGFDFIFSLTTLTSDKALVDDIHRTRRTLRSRFSVSRLMTVVENASPRAKRLLAQESIREELAKRIHTW